MTPMARNTAQQGAAFERRVIHDLSGSPDGTHPGYGYDCVRSAASKGKIDIVAIGPEFEQELWENPHTLLVKGGPMLFIQCKLTDPQIGPTARMELMDLALRAGAIAIVAHWAADETTGLKRVHYRQLTGPGPADWAPWAPGEDD